MHLDVLLRDKAFIFKLSFEFQRLPLDVQARHETKRQAYQHLLRDLIQKGIEEGSFRQVDPDLTVKILLSILSSVILTSRPTGTPLEMLNEGLGPDLKGTGRKLITNSVKERKDHEIRQLILFTAEGYLPWRACSSTLLMRS